MSSKVKNILKIAINRSFFKDRFLIKAYSLLFLFFLLFKKTIVKAIKNKEKNTKEFHLSYTQETFLLKSVGINCNKTFSMMYILFFFSYYIHCCW